MSWTVIRQPRRAGFTYIAQWKSSQTKRGSVTVGPISGDPATIDLTARLRSFDPEGRLVDGQVVDLCHAEDDHAANMVVSRARAFLYGTGDTPEAKKPAAQEPTPIIPTVPVVTPGTEHAHWTLDRYFEEVFWPARIGESKDPTDKGKTKVIARSSRVPDEGRYNLLLAPDALGQKRWIDMNQWVFGQYLDRLPVRANTKRLHRSAYAAMMKFANRKGHILTVHPFFDILDQDAPTKKPDPLSVPEVLAMLKEAWTPMHRCNLALGVGQGLRPSELLRVHHEDIDLEKRVMQVRGDPENDGRGKTALSTEEIPLTPFTIQEVRRYRTYMASRGDSAVGLVYHDEKGNSIANWRNCVKKTAKRAGVERRVYQRLLRDSFATLAFTLGVPKEVTRRIGRWTDEKMLDEVYCRPRATDLAKMLEAFVLEAPAPQVVEDVEVEGPTFLDLVAAK